MKLIFYASALLIITAISGCAGGYLTSKDIREAIEADERKGTVIAQLCFAVIPEDRPPKDFIQMEVINNDSISGTGANRIGTTASGQPLFERNTSTQSRLKALIVPYRSDLWLVFEPPKNLSFDNWSGWESAKYSTTYKSANFQLLFDRPLHKYTTSKDSLQARYRLMQHSDYSKYRRMRSLDIPPC